MTPLASAERPAPAATARDGRSVDPREIDAEMVAGLYKRVKPLIIANFGALILLTVVLWDAAQRSYLIAWAAALGGWTLVRFALARVYMQRPRPIAQTWRWTAAFAVGSGIAGILWGSSILLIDGLDSDSGKLVTAFVMAALSAAAIAGYTNSLTAFAAFLLPALLPYGHRLVMFDGTFSPGIAAFVVFWGALLWIMARHLNEGFRNSIALAVSNRNLAEGLRDERDRAQAASRAKTRFLGHMSHELRTPLNAMLGYSEMMAQQMLGPLGNPKYVDYAGDINASGRHLLQVLDQVLDVSELEAGRVALEEAEIDVAAVLREAAESAAPAAADKEIALETAPPDAPLRLRGDPARVRQMLDNLLANAVAYTPARGRVTLGAEVEATGALVLAVADTGVGIAAEALARVQIPFAQLEEQDHHTRVAGLRERDGHTTAGLGLPITRLLAELHGARLDLHSTPGEGTTARVVFPAERVHLVAEDESGRRGAA